MRPDDALLLDMLVWARDALAFSRGATWEDVRRNRMMQAAVQYAVQTIGEAASHVTPEVRDTHPAIPWPRIVGMRHRLVHGYRQIDTALVWDIVENYLAPPIAALEPLIPREDD